jgi:UDP-N-acetylglucosamine 2-epimerase (non-hydrolysing)
LGPSTWGLHSTENMATRETPVRIVSVVGARPQFVKLKPIDVALRSAGLTHDVFHTGQHYDPGLSDVFFEELHLPRPSLNLGIGSSSRWTQVTAIATGLRPVLSRARPDYVLVYGDTNSTLGAAMAAVDARVPVAHIEAGLRSRNFSMPEEFNRVAVDHMSAVRFAPTVLAETNLKAEGLEAGTFLTGDVMIDLIRIARPDLAARTPPVTDLPSQFVVATLHRKAIVEDRARLDRALTNMSSLQFPVFLVAHPGLISAADRFGLRLETGAVQVVPPLSYLDMLAFVDRAIHLITDSGGLQKEAFILGTPCITLREETEWPESLEGRRNVLDPFGDNIHDLITRQTSDVDEGAFGNGSASDNIATVLKRLGGGAQPGNDQP